MEETFSTLLRVPIELVGAGRTDAGVHARQMYAHFEAGPLTGIEDLVHRLNAFLPDDIAVQGIYGVPAETHARFDAEERTYEYWIVQQKNPFYNELAHYVRQPLDIKKMNEAAHILLQHQNFECFSKSNSDVATFLCRVGKAQWTWQGEVLVFTITADRFLRNMVRAIVGTLLNVGLGKAAVMDMEKIINSRDRAEAGASVPAKGLYLTKVAYPTALNLNVTHE
jgi:tRNA pseudouridine38-40 synthase